MKADLTLRPARPEDADRAAVLLYSAYRHQQANYPLHEAGEHQWLERLAYFFRLEGNRFSYQCTRVAEQHSEVVGLVLSFGGREEAQLNAAIGWPLERETEEDEWYIDALAVFTDWGRQGIGTRLLHTAEQQARQHGYSKIALMSPRRTMRPWPCISACSMLPPSRPASITSPMCVWSNTWQMDKRRVPVLSSTLYNVPQ